eukprot:TRINITY_DN10459_c0_g1_i5.p2 TRINITY_DN10459_c0_g1~~TRINITY_DN10459_c0_g1_i5.p2  ORF type:complete len:108 (+),score=6.93 TRINITY_DN10459_c0_g1_i5:621-944(+)
MVKDRCERLCVCESVINLKRLLKLVVATTAYLLEGKERKNGRGKNNLSSNHIANMGLLFSSSFNASQLHVGLKATKVGKEFGLLMTSPLGLTQWTGPLDLALGWPAH